MLNVDDALPFLARLGLRPDADAGAIRRAYARELKLIDQASQADQFQQLREAYEAALNWADRSVAAIEPGPETAASQVYAQFLDACIPLREKGRLRDQSGWEDALRRHLDDPRLFDLSARLDFEMKIAAYLAAGWKTGNETLFLVAATVFEWESDDRRLQQLGEAGIVIAQTLEQRYLFDCQDEAAFKVSRNVLVGLRLNVPPLNMRLRMEMAHLEVMLEYFPDLIAVTAGTENVGRWRALYAELTPPATPESVQAIVFGQHRAVSHGRAVVQELSVPLTIIFIVIALARFYYYVNRM
jgi:hypothetical protein